MRSEMSDEVVRFLQLCARRNIRLNQAAAAAASASNSFVCKRVSLNPATM